MIKCQVDIKVLQYLDHQQGIWRQQQMKRQYWHFLVWISYLLQIYKNKWKKKIYNTNADIFTYKYRDIYKC